MNARDVSTTDVEQAITAARAWRAIEPDCDRLLSAAHRYTGVALVFRGKIYGWKNELRDPQHEQPGVVAVDVDGQAWIACGGDEYHGAEVWRPAIGDQP